MNTYETGNISYGACDLSGQGKQAAGRSQFADLSGRDHGAGAYQRAWLAGTFTADADQYAAL